MLLLTHTPCVLRYALFLVTREDNVFLVPKRPLPIEQLPAELQVVPPIVPTLAEGAHVLGVNHHSVRSERMTRRRGSVAMDTHCGFLGAPSDKIFLAGKHALALPKLHSRPLPSPSPSPSALTVHAPDKKGAAILLGNSTEAHVDMLLEWLRFGQRREAAAAGHADALQSEAFLASLLKGGDKNQRHRRVSVRVLPFQRTDVRFETTDGGPCVRYA